MVTIEKQRWALHGIHGWTMHGRGTGSDNTLTLQTDDTREPRMPLHGQHGWEMHGETKGEGQDKSTHGTTPRVKYGQCIFTRESRCWSFCVSSAYACSVSLALFVLLLRGLW